MTVLDLGLFLRARCPWGIFKLVADRASEPGHIVRPPEVTHVFAVNPSRTVSERKRRRIIASAIAVAMEKSLTLSKDERRALVALARATAKNEKG